jgi:hypothetical protein
MFELRNGIHTMFPVGRRTPPIQPGPVDEMDTMLEKVDVDPLNAHTFKELYGIMVTFEFPSRTPPANEPAGQLCVNPFENRSPMGSYIPTFAL